METAVQEQKKTFKMSMTRRNQSIDSLFWRNIRTILINSAHHSKTNKKKNTADSTRAETNRVFLLFKSQNKQGRTGQGGLATSLYAT